MATIRDVARHAQVAPATVSFVLNNGPRPVSAETRARVLAAIEELQFRPNAFAQGLASRKSSQIGVVFSGFGHGLVSNPYGGRLLEGIIDGGYDLRLGVLIAPGHGDWTQDVLPYVGNGRVDGIVLIAPVQNDPVSLHMERAGFPYVEVAPFTEGRDLKCATVDVDNARGARLAVRHLASLGHTRIGHIAGDFDQQGGIDRMRGFESAMEELGLPVLEHCLVAATFSTGLDRHFDLPYEIRALLSRPERPTALFCANDWLASVAMEIAQELGMAVPDDLSVVGFDDHPNSAHLRPPLTTVSQPLQEIGKRSMLRLVASNKGQTPDPLHLRIEGELIVRASTAPPSR